VGHSGSQHPFIGTLLKHLFYLRT